MGGEGESMDGPDSWHVVDQVKDLTYFQSPERGIFSENMYSAEPCNAY